MWTPIELAAPVNNSTTVFQAATGLEFQAVAGAHYRVHFYPIYQTAATTTGIAFALNGPGGFTLFTIHRKYLISLTANLGQMSRAFNSGGPSSQVDAAAPSNVFAYGEALLHNAVDGLVQLMFASEVNLSNVGIQPGSLLLVSRVN